jgi:hypothetical protein
MAPTMMATMMVVSMVFLTAPMGMTQGRGSASPAVLVWALSRV